MQIRPVNQNNCTTFKALKRIDYKSDFSQLGYNINERVIKDLLKRPESRLVVDNDPLRVIKSFLKNDAIMKFCKKHNVFARLNLSYSQGDPSSLVLSLKGEDLFSPMTNLEFLQPKEGAFSFIFFISNISEKDIEKQKNITIILDEMAKLYNFDAENLKKVYNIRGDEINKSMNSNGSRLIHYAAMNKNKKFMELILKHPDVDINMKDSQGRTPLHYAAAREQVDNLKLLLERKDIDTDIKDVYGSTAENLAFGLSEDFYRKYRRNAYKKFW